MATNLLDLPHEVLHNIFTNTDPQDLANLCCCQTLYRFVKSDNLLHKELYLAHFDEPSGTEESEFAWSGQLKELVKLQKTLQSSNISLKCAQLEAITKSVDHLLLTAATRSKPSLNIDFLTKQFESPHNVNTLLCGSRLFDWAKAESWGSLASTRFRREIASMLNDMQQENGCASSRHTGNEGEAPEPGDTRPTPTYRNDPPVFEDVAHLVEEADAATDKTLSDPEDEFLKTLRQLSAKLHCLFGVSIDVVRKDAEASRYSLRSDTASIHPYARSLVYDLRQHTDHTLWGPFLGDGSQTVDWEKIEAIMIILDHNMKLAAEENDLFQNIMTITDKPFQGASPYSYVSQPPDVTMQPARPLEAQDPYNITGTWMRIVTFLDYTELYDFNFDGDPIPDNQPRRPINTDEAFRLITMKIHVTKIEPPGEDDGQALPVVHFTGNSSSVRPSFDPNANSKTKGTVRLTPQGDVRWTTWTVFHGEERWRSEGIQVGGVQAARGVLGYWFDTNFDEHGPAGPTSFWKIHDGIEQRKPHSPMTHFTFPMY